MFIKEEAGPVKVKQECKEEDDPLSLKGNLDCGYWNNVIDLLQVHCDQMNLVGVMVL